MKKEEGPSEDGPGGWGRDDLSRVLLVVYITVRV